MHRFTRPFATRAPRSPRSRRTVAVLTTLALAAGLAGVTGANATTAFNPPAPETGASGPIVRNDSMNLKVDTGGRVFSRVLGTQPFAAQSTALGIALSGCLGNNPAGTDLSPRSRLVVTGPGGTVLDQTSPVKVIGTDNAATPQPAPANGNYLGGPWSTTLSLAGKPAGVYTVTTTITNKVRTGFPALACTTGTPTPSGTSFAAGPVNESWTFEYRPWQHKFEDLLGTGTVQMNTSPEEFKFDLSNGGSPIVTGTAGADAMRLYSLPNSASFQLSIPNPGACGSDPLGCLPDTAISCNPALGCQPRLATINYNDGTDKLVGLFDLETKAFAAVVTADGHTRILLSGGTDVDGTLHTLLDQLNQMAAGLGVDLPKLLGTTVDLNLQRPDGSTDVVQISVLRLIEIFNVPNGPATGIGLPHLSAGAGVISHLGVWLTGAPINPALRDADGVDHSGFGYTITDASALPAIPSLPAPLNVLVPPGKIKHVTGKIPAGSGGHLVAIGATTDPDAANGLPFSVPPVSTPGLVPDEGIDFIGTTVTAASAEVCIPLLGQCFGGAALVGTGVATFGESPLPIDFGSLPLIWGDELGLGSVMAQVDGVVDSVLSNPAVQQIVNTVMTSVPALPIPGLPTAPGGGTTGIPGVPGGLLGLPGSLPLGNLPLGNLPIGSLLSSLLGMF